MAKKRTLENVADIIDYSDVETDNRSGTNVLKRLRTTSLNFIVSHAAIRVAIRVLKM